MTDESNFFDIDISELDQMVTNFTNRHTTPASPPSTLPDQFFQYSPSHSIYATSSASLSSNLSTPQMETSSLSSINSGIANCERFREANIFASDASNSSSVYGDNTRTSSKKLARKSTTRRSSSKRSRSDRSEYLYDNDDDDDSETDSFFDTILDQSLHYSLLHAPKKRSKLFNIQICLRQYAIEITRDYLFDQFTALTKSTVIVAREAYCSKYANQPSKYRAPFAFKIFIDLGSNASNSVDMQKTVSAIIRRGVQQDEQEFSLQDQIEGNITDEDRVSEISFFSVKNRRAAIYWASATDIDLRYTPDCSIWDDFSESYRLQMWCLQNIHQKFDPFHPLVMRLKKGEAMQKMLTLFQRKHHIRHKLKRVTSDIPFGDWRDDLILWFNNWIDNGWHMKKQQVLITGPPNAGKTSFIDNVLLKGIPSAAILTPEKSSNRYQISNFAWSKADEVYHSIVYADEFEIDGYDQGKLKVILQGGKFMPQKKFVNMKTCDEIQLKIPMIFVGNYHFPKSAIDLGIPERFLQIRIPDELPVYSPNGQEPYNTEVFENHIHVHNAIKTVVPLVDTVSTSTQVTTSDALEANENIAIPAKEVDVIQHAEEANVDQTSSNEPVNEK